MSFLISVLFLGSSYPIFGEINFYILEYHNYNVINLKSLYLQNHNLFFMAQLCIFSIFFAFITFNFSNILFNFLNFYIEYVNFFFYNHFLWFLIKFFFILWLFIAVRAIVPRYRYDQLMILGWKTFLPLSLFFFIFFSTFFFLVHLLFISDNYLFIDDFLINL